MSSLAESCPLVVGYGNPLRGDDGFGRHAADRLAAEAHRLPPGTVVISCHQLTPELTEDVARASVVVLVDAAAPGEPGALAVSRVTPGEARAWSHHLDPEGIMALAARLYGAAPPAFLVSVGAAAFAAAEVLSPEVEAALPAAVATVMAVLAAPASVRTAGFEVPGRTENSWRGGTR
jgi:hydrogenase maturation protease